MNESQTVILRADASASSGLGHVARLAALGIAILQRGSRVVFATRSPQTGTSEFLGRIGLPVAELADGSFLELRALAEREAASAVAFDGYDVDAATIDRIEEEGLPTLYVDDEGLLTASHASLVVNQNFFADDIAYQLGSGRVLLRGPAFALLRPEFSHAKTSDFPAKAEPSLLLTFGGADPLHQTEMWIRACASLPIRAHVEIVIGAAHSEPAGVRAAAAQLANVTVTVNAADMADRILRASAVVTAAGSTCLEIACIGRPAIAVVTAANQRRVAASVRSLGLMSVVDVDANLEERSRALTALLTVGQSAAVSRQRALVDGQGAIRVANELAILVSRRAER